MYRVLTGKHERNYWKDIGIDGTVYIETDMMEKAWTQIDLAQDRHRRRAFVNAVMNLLFS